MPSHYNQKYNVPFYHLVNKQNTSFLFLDLLNLAVSRIQTAAVIYRTNPDLLRRMMSDFYVGSLSFRKAIFKKQKSFSDFGVITGIYDPNTEQEIVKTQMIDGVFEEIYLMSKFNNQFYMNPNNLLDINDTAINPLSQNTFDTSEKIGYIRELPGNEPNLKILLLKDEKYFLTERQSYKIKMTFKFIDNFKKEVMSRLDNLTLAKNNVDKVYASFFGNVSNSDIISFFSGSGISLNADLSFNSISDPQLYNSSIYGQVSKSLREALELLSGDTNYINSAINRIVSSLYINQNTVEKFLDVSAFLNNIIREIRIKYDLPNENYKKSTLNEDLTKEYSVIIDNEIKAQDEELGLFKYFENDRDDPFLTPEALLTRSQQEINKFFSSAPKVSQIKQITEDLSDEDVAQMADVQTSAYTYFRPTSFISGDTKIDFSSGDLSIFDESKHDTINNIKFIINRDKSRKKQKLNRKAGTTRKISNSPFLGNIQTGDKFTRDEEGEADDTLLRVTDYLGLSTTINNRDTNLKSRLKKKSSEAVKTIQRIFSQNKKIKSFVDFSLTDSQSIVLKNKNNINFSNVPLQLKSLILSNYGLSRFSFDFEESDLMKNARYSNIINNVFTRIKVANYISGFDLNEDGLRDLTNPVVSQLNEAAVNSGQTLVITMQNYTDEYLDFVEEDGIADSTNFIISGRVNNSLPTFPNLLSPIPEVGDIQTKLFSSTNPIKQFSKRNQISVFKSENPISTPTAPQPTPVNRTTSIRPTTSGNRVPSTPAPTNRTPSGGSY